MNEAQHDDNIRPVPFPQMQQLRHTITPLRFDGQHNTQHLQLSFDDGFNDDTADDVDTFDGRWRNLFTVHFTSHITVTIQNMYTHDTGTLHGTVTHQYRTRRRDHRARLTYEIPIRYRLPGYQSPAEQ